MSAAQTLRLPSRGLIDVCGPEARGFLHRLLTQDVETLSTDGLRYGALLTPQGRVLYDLFLWGEPDCVRLDVALDARDPLMQRLSMFRLRAAVEIAASDDGVYALWDSASAPAGWREDPRTPLAGFRYVGPSSAATAEAIVVDPSAYLDHRFGLGLAEAWRDGLSDRAYATEADLDLLNGVDFRKGCFVGQETTSRMKRRNGVRSRVLPLDFEGEPPAPGAEVLAGALRAGEVIATRSHRALAMLRLDRAVGPMTIDGRSVTRVTPAWAEADLASNPPPSLPGVA